MADKALQSTSIKRNLQCPVCFDVYSHMTKIPKSLLCGHTVCADCLKNILLDNRIKCPVCRKKHTSKGSIDDIPTNFTALSIVDCICQDCRNAPKTDQCLSRHCNQELCDLCLERHLQAFHSYYQQEFSALQAEITQLETSCPDTEGLHRMIDEQHEVIMQVNIMCQGLKDQIERIRTATIQMIEAKVESSTNSFLQWQKNLNKILDEGKKIVEQSKKLSFMNKDLYNKCETLRKELVEKSQQMPSFIDCSLTPYLSDITTLLPDHLNVSYSTVTQAVGSLNRERSPVKPVISIEDYRSYKGRVVYDGSFPWDISVSQSTGVIAFTSDRGALHIMSDQFEVLTSYIGEGSAAGMMRCAWGTVISRDNKIFVSDCLNHKIHVSDVHGRHLYHIGSEGGGQGQLRGPLGLAMDEDDTLFVCDKNNNRICCFTPDGSFIRQFGSKGSGEGHFRSEPQFIAASRRHDKVAVSDWQGNLYIFSHGGDHHRTIRAGTAPYNMWARGVAIDAAGHIIVADGNGYQLLVLDDSLLVVARMGSRGDGPGQLSGPHGVAVTPRGEVLVCDNMINCIKIFSSACN